MQTDDDRALAEKQPLRDKESAGARLKQKVDALPEAEREEIRSYLRAVGKSLSDSWLRSEAYVVDLLRRLGLTPGERFDLWLELWAAARYVGLSSEEFYDLTLREVCAVLEYKAAERVSSVRKPTRESTEAIQPSPNDIGQGTGTPTNEKIRTLRMECGWTQEMLAKKVGVSESAIKKHESGKHNPSRAHREQYRSIFSKELGVAIGENLDKLST